MSYTYSAEAFTSVKRGGRDALGTGGGASSYGKGSTTSGLQTVTSDSGQLFETYIAEDGFFAILNNFNSVDDNGFYISLDPVFSIYSSDEAIATAIEVLSTQQMVVLKEVYPYNYTGFDESNTEITLFASAYNGLTDPTTTVLGSVSLDGEQIGYYYTVAYDSNEVSGLRDKFGYQAGSSVENQIDSAVQTIAAEVLNSYMSKRQALKRTKRIRVDPSSFSSLRAVRLTATGSMTSSPSTPTAGY